MIPSLRKPLHQIPADFHVNRTPEPESRDDTADPGRTANQPILLYERPAIGPRDAAGGTRAIVYVQT